MTKNPHAMALGRLGGLATRGKTSAAKQAAARANGAKGGRPRLPLAGGKAGGAPEIVFLDRAGVHISPPRDAVVPQCRLCGCRRTMHQAGSQQNRCERHPACRWVA